MKFKSIFAYTALVSSVVFLGVVGVNNKTERLNRVSARVLEGDISALGDNEYYYKDFGITEDVLLTLNNKGISTTIDNERRYDNINMYASGNLDKLKFSDEFIKEYKEFLDRLEVYEPHNLYFLDDYKMAIYRNSGSDGGLALELIINNNGKIEEDVITVPYDTVKLKDSEGISDFTIKTATRNQDKLQMLITLDHSLKTDDYSYDNIKKMNIYVEFDLKSKKTKVRKLEGFVTELGSIIKNDTLYLTSSEVADDVLEYNLLDENEPVKVQELMLPSDDMFATSFGFERIGETFYYISVLNNGNVNLRYFDPSIAKMHNYSDLKVFTQEDLKPRDQVSKENKFKISQVFIEDGKLFINYDYKQFGFNRKSYMKVVNLKTNKVEFTLELASMAMYLDSEYGKIVE
ncbi:MAG: hypothetical protein ACRC6T_09330 [Sarcina sp.]